MSCTGTGEELIWQAAAQTIAARAELAGEPPTPAAQAVVLRTLRCGDGGVIAVSHRGEVALAYGTGGMLRGSCAAAGALDAPIWEGSESGDDVLFIQTPRDEPAHEVLSFVGMSPCETTEDL